MSLIDTNIEEILTNSICSYITYMSLWPLCMDVNGQKIKCYKETSFPYLPTLR